MAWTLEYTRTAQKQISKTAPRRPAHEMGAQAGHSPPAEPLSGSLALASSPSLVASCYALPDGGRGGLLL